MKPTVSYSAWACFAHCRYKYKKQYEQGLSPKTQSFEADLGTGIHKHLAFYFQKYFESSEIPPVSIMDMSAIDWREQLLDGGISIEGNAVADKFNTAMDDGITEMVHKSVQIAKRTVAFFHPEDYEVVAINGVPCIEYEFNYPLPDHFAFSSFHGFIDLVIMEKRTGLIYIVDHKSSKSLKPEEDEIFRIQLAVYQYILQKLGIPVAGTMTLQILAKDLEVPELLASGKMSRKAIKSDWSTYKQALLDKGLDPTEYAQEMIPKLNNVTFFMKNIVLRSQVEIENTWNEIFYPALVEMSDLEIPRWRYLSSFLCRSCSFKEVCLGELQGRDMSYEETTFFYKRKDKVYEMMSDMEIEIEI